MCSTVSDQIQSTQIMGRTLYRWLASGILARTVPMLVGVCQANKANASLTPFSSSTNTSPNPRSLQQMQIVKAYQDLSLALQGLQNNDSNAHMEAPARIKDELKPRYKHTVDQNDNNLQGCKCKNHAKTKHLPLSSRIQAWLTGRQQRTHPCWLLRGHRNQLLSQNQSLS